MTKHTWMSAPAGVLGQGSVDARPFGGVAVRAAAQPPFAAVHGTGLPVTRPRSFGVVPTVTALGTTCTPRFIAQNDGTTLGFHPSSRPLS